MNAGPANADRAGQCTCGVRRVRNFIAEAESLFQQFNGFEASQAIRIRHRRLMPSVVVELGSLAGLIYRSNKGRPGSRMRTYIHFMEEQPRLVSNVEGTQLYIVGGNYRVGARGIEG